MENLAALINGEPTSTIDVADRGLHYGDGLFETIHVLQGKPQLWDLHMARLQRGCETLGLPMVDSLLLANEAHSICSGSSQAVLKIILTRGSGGRGYRVPEWGKVTRILTLHTFPIYPERYWEEGVAVRICHLRLARQPALAGIKHLNRLEQVLARQEWSDPDIVEGILLDTEGDVIEAVMSNLFLVNEGILYTPDLTHCGVAGVMREHILYLAEISGIPTEIKVLSKSDLFNADELFLTNSLMGIWPVTRIERQHLSIGPVTRQLQQAQAKYA